MQAEAAHRQHIAVGEIGELDALPVVEETVQAAVVERLGALVIAIDQGVAARDVEGFARRRSNNPGMPDLATIMLRRSAQSLDSGRKRCAGCRRTPLVGERVHEMDTGRMLCELCVSALPEEDRRAVSSEMVHALDKQLSVAPRAA